MGCGISSIPGGHMCSPLFSMLVRIAFWVCLATNLNMVALLLKYHRQLMPTMLVFTTYSLSAQLRHVTQ